MATHAQQYAFPSMHKSEQWKWTQADRDNHRELFRQACTGFPSGERSTCNVPVIRGTWYGLHSRCQELWKRGHLATCDCLFVPESHARLNHIERATYALVSMYMRAVVFAERQYPMFKMEGSTEPIEVTPENVEQLMAFYWTRLLNHLRSWYGFFGWDSNKKRQERFSTFTAQSWTPLKEDFELRTNLIYKWREEWPLKKDHILWTTQPEEIQPDLVEMLATLRPVPPDAQPHREPYAVAFLGQPKDSVKFDPQNVFTWQGAWWEPLWDAIQKEAPKVQDAAGNEQFVATGLMPYASWEISQMLAAKTLSDWMLLDAHAKGADSLLTNAELTLLSMRITRSEMLLTDGLIKLGVQETAMPPHLLPGQEAYLRFLATWIEGLPIVGENGEMVQDVTLGMETWDLNLQFGFTTIDKVPSTHAPEIRVDITENGMAEAYTVHTNPVDTANHGAYEEVSRQED